MLPCVNPNTYRQNSLQKVHGARELTILTGVEKEMYEAVKRMGHKMPYKKVALSEQVERLRAGTQSWYRATIPSGTKSRGGTRT